MLKLFHRQFPTNGNSLKKALPLLREGMTASKYYHFV